MIALTSGLVRLLTFALPSLYLVLFALPPGADARLALAARRLGAPVPFGDPSDPVWAPGGLIAWGGAGLCVVALVLAIWLFRDVSARFKSRDYVGGVLGLATTIAIVVMIAGTAAMPAYDRQRTYRPIIELVKTEIDRGRRVALASREAKIVGEFVFYTGREMPLVDPVPGARAFLEGGPEANGVVVRRDQLASIETSLRGLDYEVLTVDASAGENARELCLITRPRRGP
jgi:hypothetical protein